MIVSAWIVHKLTLRNCVDFERLEKHRDDLHMLSHRHTDLYRVVSKCEKQD